MLHVRKETLEAFDRIMGSSIFRIGGPSIDLCEALQALCAEIGKEEEDSDWAYMGECLECDCSSLLIGAYWALTEWHGGQSSPEYATLCAIGRIYTPNMASEPEPESSEEIAYQMIDEYFRALHG